MRDWQVNLTLCCVEIKKIIVWKVLWSNWLPYLKKNTNRRQDAVTKEHEFECYRCVKNSETQEKNIGGFKTNPVISQEKLRH